MLANDDGEADTGRQARWRSTMTMRERGIEPRGSTKAVREPASWRAAGGVGAEPQFRLGGVTASKRQCSESDDICSICHAEFQKPILLICQVIRTIRIHFCQVKVFLRTGKQKYTELDQCLPSDYL